MTNGWLNETSLIPITDIIFIYSYINMVIVNIILVSVTFIRKKHI